MNSCRTIVLCVIWSIVGIANCKADGPLTPEDVQRVIKKYTDIWNSSAGNAPLWVVEAGPGDAIAIPGITFGTKDEPRAGMSVPIPANLIVLNKGMVLESLLSTFRHEYGHTKYQATHQAQADEIASETEAIRYSLEALANEGFESLAYREAQNVMQMAGVDPYKTAVARLANDPLWKKYARVSFSK